MKFFKKDRLELHIVGQNSLFFFSNAVAAFGGAACVCSRSKTAKKTLIQVLKFAQARRQCKLGGEGGIINLWLMVRKGALLGTNCKFMELWLATRIISCSPNPISLAAEGSNHSTPSKNLAEPKGSAKFLAERVGFEPTVPCGTLVLQTSRFGRSRTSP